MPVNLSIKNVPDEVAQRLRARARRRNRSLQGELMTILKEAVGEESLTVGQLAARLKQLGLRTESDAVEIVRGDRDGR
jgi:plasmid stability protein